MQMVVDLFVFVGPSALNLVCNLTSMLSIKKMHDFLCSQRSHTMTLRCYVAGSHCEIFVRLSR